MFLHLFGGNEFVGHAAWAEDVGFGTVVRNLRIVLDALHPKQGNTGRNFCEENVYMPGASKARTEAQKFARRSGFPALIYACIDGTHVKVSSIDLDLYT